MGIMGTDPSEAEAGVREERHAQQQRESRDAHRRAEMVRHGEKRPDGEFLGLGVVVRDGEVLAWSTSAVRVLGPLAGAQAGLAGAVKTRGAGTAVAAGVALGELGALAALAARGSKPFAYVIFPDGTLHQAALTDKRLARRAQADVPRFNALAAQAARAGS
jgi:hypothetical protein